MIRVGDPLLFSELEGGKVAAFPIAMPRTVRMTFNAPVRTVVNLLEMHEDGAFPDVPPIFLAVVEGLAELEFYVHGPFAIQADADHLYLKSVDGDAIHAVVPDAQTFTRIAERRARNPEMERLQAMLLQNQERRMGAMLEEARLERERWYRERETDDSGTGAHGGDSPPPVPSASTRKPAGGAETPPVGTEGGGGDA